MKGTRAPFCTIAIKKGDHLLAQGRKGAVFCGVTLADIHQLPNEEAWYHLGVYGLSGIEGQRYSVPANQPLNLGAITLQIILDEDQVKLIIEGPTGVLKCWRSNTLSASDRFVCSDSEQSLPQCTAVIDECGEKGLTLSLEGDSPYALEHLPMQSGQTLKRGKLLFFVASEEEGLCLWIQGSPHVATAAQIATQETTAQHPALDLTSETPVWQEK